MRLYSGSVHDFATALSAGTLVPAMEHQFAQQMLYRPSPSEITSWANSLPVLGGDLTGAGLQKASIVLEYMLPLSSKRLDAIVLGQDQDGLGNAVVIELKQWRRAEITSVEDRPENLGGQR